MLVRNPSTFHQYTHLHGAQKHTRLGILQHGSDTVNCSTSYQEDLHENGIDATLMNRRSNQVHQFTLAQVHVHVRRSRQLELLNLLELHFGGANRKSEELKSRDIKKKD